MVTFYLYRSRARQPYRIGPDTLEILRASLRNNARRNITGFLHQENGFFYQYLEGEKRDVEDLYSAICADWRHFDVKLLDHGERDARLFIDFEMGFLETHGRELCDRSSVEGETRPSKVLEFLLDSRSRLQGGRELDIGA